MAYKVYKKKLSASEVKALQARRDKRRAKHRKFRLIEAWASQIHRWLKRLLAAYLCLIFLAVGYLLAHILHWPFPLVMTLWAPLASVLAILLVIGSLWGLARLISPK